MPRETLKFHNDWTLDEVTLPDATGKILCRKYVVEHPNSQGPLYDGSDLAEAEAAFKKASK
jgi:hypothetical protein